MSAIEWTDKTWNPITGCSKFSPGCKNCYAERFAERWRGTIGHPYQYGFDIRFWRDRLLLPLKWKKPQRIFVNSMSDIFHEDVPFSFIQSIWLAMQRASHHTFQILTKRSERMLNLSKLLNWPRNIWMGVSVENEDYTFRIEHLRDMPAEIKFLSIEPLLGPLPNLNLTGIDWVIVGGESGPRARPMKENWAREIRDNCKARRIPFFMKQMAKKRKIPEDLFIREFPYEFR